MSILSSQTFAKAAQAVIDDFSQASTMYANSLILSIYGDTICPHGGNIWLGSLIKLVEPLGINQRLVRTSVFRLSEKKILKAKQIGRRSYYSLTDKGFRQFSSAAKRIYQGPLQTWDGEWRLVITSLGGLEQEQRETVRKELFWLGFTHITTGVFVHPTIDLATVKQMVDEMQLTEHIVMLQAKTMDDTHIPIANALIKNCFNVQAFEPEYQEFYELFHPVLEAVRATHHNLDPRLCFLMRTLLIHKYRRILLREPELPQGLINEDSWSWRARLLMVELYQTIAKPADEYFTELSETEKGKFACPTSNYYQRFAAVS
ncbi:PaaX family transcriptional regulator C-terminal domain-containing protein [Thiofilum sp.]|uniref:PaaX family transcriptional regulator C-terminal domain-containing protein n=1 Tax=Thiofilum sp. TaxID=2212733 RepID=UPI003BAEDDD3